LAIRPFESLETELLPVLEAESRDIGRFLDTPAALGVDEGG
jgi:hypothetical protein